MNKNIIWLGIYVADLNPILPLKEQITMSDENLVMIRSVPKGGEGLEGLKPHNPPQ